MEVSVASIATRVASCLESFNTLHLAIADTSLQNKLTECTGRFRVWSGNIGAHQTGKKSLDYRLRGASYVMLTFANLLRDLTALLLDASSIANGSRQPLDSAIDSDSSDTGSEPDGTRPERPSEIQQIFMEISQVITSLYRLSMTVRKSTWNNRYLKSASINVSFFERYDIEHVAQKFPNADRLIVERLGRGISRRRQYFKYRELHAAKLAYVVDENDDGPAPSETTASVFAKTQSKDERDLTTDGDVQSIMTETSFATSHGSPTKVHFPPMPKAASNGQPFECPFCYRIEVAETTHEWRKHVYRDLQPYMCTFKECAIPDETYASRRQWFSHELQKHRKVWHCSGHCDRKFESGEQLTSHLKAFWPVSITDAQIPALLDMRASPISRDEKLHCVLCRLEIIGRNQLQKHLGYHFEELALFALPNDNEESDEDLDSLAATTESGASLDRDLFEESDSYEKRQELGQLQEQEPRQSKKPGISKDYQDSVGHDVERVQNSYDGLFSSALPPKTADSPKSPENVTPARTAGRPLGRVAQILRGVGAKDDTITHASSRGSSSKAREDSVVGNTLPQKASTDVNVIFLAASVYDFNIDRIQREAGYPYLTYVAGEIFEVIGEKGELWLARNQDDPNYDIGWIWSKHFTKIESS